MVFPRALLCDQFSSSFILLRSSHSLTKRLSVLSPRSTIIFTLMTLNYSSLSHLTQLKLLSYSFHVTLAAISQWMAFNFLTLNPPKTEFLIIGLPTQLSKLHMPTLTLPDNSSITPVESARNLGIIFDSNLSFGKHIGMLLSYP